MTATKVFLFLLLTITVNAKQYTVKNGWYFEPNLKQKKAPPEVHIVTSFVRSALQCSMNCVKTDYCQSIGYNRKTRECILQWSLSDDVNMKPVDAPDFVIFDRSPPLEINQRIMVSLCQLLIPCQNGANCTDLPGPDYQCTCASGYNGKNCQEVSVCITETPCVHGGNCTDGLGLTYSCECIEGYSGDNCTEVSVCMTETPCVHGGNCTDGSGLTYSCECIEGYSGDNCTEVSVCMTETPCVHGGNCTDGLGLTYPCECIEGYSGDNCTEVSVCTLETPCANGGNCTDGLGLNYTCDCLEKYIGDNCTEGLPEYRQTSCANGDGVSKNALLLGQHDLSCGETVNRWITRFQAVDCTGFNLRYAYTCNGNWQSNSDCFNTATQCGNLGGTSNTVRYLEQHKIDCSDGGNKEGHFLSRFHLKQCGNLHVQYEYTCCKKSTNNGACTTKETVKNTMDGLVYFFFHNIDCQGKYLKDFQMFNADNYQKALYKYTCCDG